MESINDVKFSFHSFCLAIKNDEFSRASKMLTQGADLTQRDDLGETLLHKVIHSFNQELLQVLLSIEVDLNAKDMKGQTALHAICSAESPWVMAAAFLLDKGADVSVRDVLGQTPLHLACSLCKDEYLYGYLMDYGASSDVDTPDINGRTPLHLAAASTSPESPGFVLSLLKYGASMDIPDKEGKTALHAACSSPWTVVAAILLQEGAKVSVRDVLGQTPLHLACSLCKDEYLYGYLMDYGASADVDTPDINGRTPLHLAAASTSPKSSRFVYYLLRDGASMDIPDKEGKTAPHAARPSSLILFTKYVFVAQCANLSVDVDFPFDFGGLENLKSDCLKELEIMKGIKFGKHLLRDLFSQCHDPALLEDDEILDEIQVFFKSPFFNDVFLIYGGFLRDAVEKGKGRLVLLGDAQKSFNVLLPNEMRRKILSYISDKDLINVIEAANFR